RRRAGTRRADLRPGMGQRRRAAGHLRVQAACAPAPRRTGVRAARPGIRERDERERPRGREGPAAGRRRDLAGRFSGPVRSVGRDGGPRQRSRGSRAGAGNRSARERLASAWREGLARRDEGRAAAKVIRAPEHADATDRAAGARRDSEGLAALVAEAGEAYRSGYVAKDIDPDAARRAFGLVVALLPPGDETALKARRWL